MSETYQCARCGGVFEKTTSDEDALAEMAQIFGPNSLDEPRAVVCDVCWRIMVPDGKPIRAN